MELFTYNDKIKCLNRFLFKDRKYIQILTIFIAISILLTVVNAILHTVTNFEIVVSVSLLLLSIIIVFVLLNNLSKKLKCEESNYNISRNSLSGVYTLQIYVSRVVIPIIVTAIFSLINNLIRFPLGVAINLSFGLILFQLFLFSLCFALLYINQVSRSIFLKLLVLALLVNTLLVLLGLNDRTPIIFLDYVLTTTALFLFDNYVMAFIIVFISIFSSISVAIKCFENICRNK